VFGVNKSEYMELHQNIGIQKDPLYTVGKNGQVFFASQLKPGEEPLCKALKEMPNIVCQGQSNKICGGPKFAPGGVHQPIWEFIDRDWGYEDNQLGLEAILQAAQAFAVFISRSNVIFEEGSNARLSMLATWWCFLIIWNISLRWFREGPKPLNWRSPRFQTATKRWANTPWRTSRTRTASRRTIPVIEATPNPQRPKGGLLALAQSTLELGAQRKTGPSRYERRLAAKADRVKHRSNEDQRAQLTEELEHANTQIRRLLHAQKRLQQAIAAGPLELPPVLDLSAINSEYSGEDDENPPVDEDEVEELPTQPPPRRRLAVWASRPPKAFFVNGASERPCTAISDQVPRRLDHVTCQVNRVP
jgi:hypothetical protein